MGIENEDILIEKLESNGFVLKENSNSKEYFKKEVVDLIDINMLNMTISSRVRIYNFMTDCPSVEAYEISALFGDPPNSRIMFRYTFNISKHSMEYFDYYIKNIPNIYKLLMYISSILVKKIRERENRLTPNFVFKEISADDGTDDRISICPRLINIYFGNNLHDIGLIELSIGTNDNLGLILDVKYDLFNGDKKLIESMKPVKIKTFLGKNLKEIKKTINRNRVIFYNHPSLK